MSAVVSLALPQTANYFRRVYSLADKKAQLLKRNKTFSLMEKDDTKLGSGDGFFVTVKSHRARSTSSTFEYGMSDQAASNTFRWFIDGPKTLHGRLTIDNRTLRQAKSGGALIDLKKVEMEEIAQGFVDRVEAQLWGTGSGVLGQITFTGAEPTLLATCVLPSDIYNVESGMVVIAATTASGGIVAGNAYTVSDVGIQAGTFTMTRKSAAQIGTPASPCYVFVRGDMDRAIPGIPKFIPATAETTALLGYNRTGKEIDNGWRGAFLGSIESTIKKLFSVMGRFVDRDKRRYSVCLSYGDWLKLDEELAGRIYRDPASEQTFGTDIISVRVPGGTVPCIALPIMADGRGYIIDWSTWTLYTMDGIPHVMDEDGQTWQKMLPGKVDETVSNASPGNASTDYLNGDGVWMGLRAWFHCLCTNPLANATFPTL